MTPSRGRATYQPKRDRREVMVAVLVVLVIVAVTGTLLWLLRPDHGTDTVPSTPTISLPTHSTVPTTPATAVPAP